MPNVRVRITTQPDLSGDGIETQEKAENKPTAGGKMAVVSILGHQALNTAKTILNYSISNIGNFTGNSVLQENVQTAVGVVGDLASIGLATATGGWVGLVVSSLSVATKYTMQIATANIDARKSNNESAFIRERSGNATTNGSRTGD